MAKQLTYRPLDNVGINGLNTQANPLTLDTTWLTRADNVVVKESGRLSSRKGLKQAIPTTSANIGAIAEYDDNGTKKVFASSGAYIYQINFSNPASAYNLSHNVSGAESDWQFINFNRKLYAVQSGQTPLEYSGSWSAFANKPSGVTTFDPSCGMGYYGRLWVGGLTEAKDVVYYSDTLIGTEWAECSDPQHTTQSACEASNTWTPRLTGYIDLKAVWGNDDIVAIAPFYGQLVIFGKRNIVIYQNPDDPNNMALTEVIRGIGCVSRDSIQAVGDDLIFVSDTGVRSLSRTSELDKVPLVDLSVNVKDTMIRDIGNSHNIKSCYVENEGVYIMSFTDKNITYVLDMKHITPNRAPRITTWSFTNNREPSSMAFTKSQGFLVGQQAGSIATYEAYLDKDYVNSSTHTNHKYTSGFTTNWIELGESVAASLLKKFKAVFSGGSGTSVGVKWYKDLEAAPYKSHTISLSPSTSGTPAYFGDAEFTSSSSSDTKYEFGEIFGLREYSIPMSGSAKYLQIGMDTLVSGHSVSLQDLTLLFKQGKIR